MELSSEILFFLSTLGWFNGIILGMYFTIFYSGKTLPIALFGFMLLALSVRVAKSALWWFYPDLPLIVIQLGLAACLFAAILLYYYVKATNDDLKKIPRTWIITLTGYGVTSLVLLFFFSSKEYLTYWRHYIVPAIYYHWFIVIILTGFELRGRFVALFKKDLSLKPNDRWLLVVYGGNFIIALGYGLSFFGFSKVSYITGPIIFSLILYLNTLILLYRKKPAELFQAERPKYVNKKIAADAASMMIAQLERLITETDIYKRPDLKLNDLATSLNISPHQLSQLFNDNLGKPFNTYINDYRIKKACEVISQNGNLKLEAVGYEVGFNSKSAFFAAFKKTTGITPKSFKERLA